MTPSSITRFVNIPPLSINTETASRKCKRKCILCQFWNTLAMSIFETGQNLIGLLSIFMSPKLLLNNPPAPPHTHTHTHAHTHTHTHTHTHSFYIYPPPPIMSYLPIHVEFFSTLLIFSTKPSIAPICNCGIQTMDKAY